MFKHIIKSIKNRTNTVYVREHVQEHTHPITVGTHVWYPKYGKAIVTHTITTGKHTLCFIQMKHSQQQYTVLRDYLQLST